MSVQSQGHHVCSRKTSQGCLILLHVPEQTNQLGHVRVVPSTGLSSTPYRQQCSSSAASWPGKSLTTWCLRPTWTATSPSQSSLTRFRVNGLRTSHRLQCISLNDHCSGVSSVGLPLARVITLATIYQLLAGWLARSLQACKAGLTAAWQLDSPLMPWWREDSVDGRAWAGRARQSSHHNTATRWSCWRTSEIDPFHSLYFSRGFVWQAAAIAVQSVNIALYD